MKAIQVHELTGTSGLAVTDVAVPEPAPGHVVVTVKAAGVAFPDLLQTRGEYQVKPPLPFTPGSEGSGIVAAVGDGVTHVAPGDRVAFLSGANGWSESVSVPAPFAFPIPDSLAFAAAAALPMNLLTADFALRVRGNLRPGQTLLVHGAAGGLGSALVQLGLAIGAEVVAVVSSQAKADMVLRLGATHAVLAEGFKDAVKEIYPKGVDLIADPVGGDRFTDSLRSLATGGAIVVLGFTGGDIPQVKVNRLLLGNTSVLGAGWGEALRSRTLDPAQQWRNLLPYLEQGVLDPHIHGAYPLDASGAATALNELADRKVLGKAILEP